MIELSGWKKLTRCGLSVFLTNEQIATARRWPDRYLGEVKPRVNCALGPAHAGPHAGFIRPVPVFKEQMELFIDWGRNHPTTFTLRGDENLLPYVNYFSKWEREWWRQKKNAR